MWLEKDIEKEMALLFENFINTTACFSGAVSLWSGFGIRKKTKGSLSLWRIIIYITIPLGERSEHIMLSLEKRFSFLIWILVVMFLRLNVSPEIRFIC